MTPNTVKIIRRAPLPYLLIILKAIDWEKSSLSYMQNLKTVN